MKMYTEGRDIQCVSTRLRSSGLRKRFRTHLIADLDGDRLHYLRFFGHLQNQAQTFRSVRASRKQNGSHGRFGEGGTSTLVGVP